MHLSMVLSTALDPAMAAHHHRPRSRALCGHFRLRARVFVGALVLAAAAPASAGELDETGRLFAGLPLPEDSALGAKFRADEDYAGYVKAITRSWNSYRRRTLEPVRTWASTELQVDPEVVFYPFSGPDILNAVSFFPSARTFILVGLEHIGEIPQPLGAPVEHTLEGLASLRGALRPIMGLNFFRTLDIQTELRAHPYSGTAGLMLFFLSRLDYEVVDARRVAITPEGALVDFARQSRRDHVWGVEIRFRAHGEREPRTVYYFLADLSDGPWAKHPGFTRFLAGRREMVTFLKAASYLMFKDRFNGIRGTILNGSRLVVQDASGVPFKYFEEGHWSLKLYGRYTGPISLFGPRDQEDLRSAMAKDSRGALPFVFGYDRRASRSHLIVAAKRPGEVSERSGSADAGGAPPTP
jgi:hypothetical protein